MFSQNLLSTLFLQDMKGVVRKKIGKAIWRWGEKLVKQALERLIQVRGMVGRGRGGKEGAGRYCPSKEMQSEVNVYLHTCCL